jgi:hypothetical protein
VSRQKKAAGDAALALARAAVQNGEDAVPGLLTLDLAPLAVPIELAAALTGLSTTSIYVANSEHKVVVRKFGTRSLVDFASLKEFIASLPTATMRVARDRRRDP